MKAMIVISTVLAFGACKDKGTATPETSGSGGAGTAAPAPAKGDAEVAAALRLLAAVTTPIHLHRYECAPMKAAFDPALASVQAESKIVIAGSTDPEIGKRLAAINDQTTPLGKAWHETYGSSLDCPEVSGTLAQAIGLK